MFVNFRILKHITDRAVFGLTVCRKGTVGAVSCHEGRYVECRYGYSLSLNLGARRRWVTTGRVTAGEDQVRIGQETGWASGPVSLDEKYLAPTGI